MSFENQSENSKFPETALEIKRMRDIDQDMRKRQLAEENYWDETIDAKHTERMKEIVAEIGWPTVSKVGKRKVRIMHGFLCNMLTVI